MLPISLFSIAMITIAPMAVSAHDKNSTIQTPSPILKKPAGVWIDVRSAEEYAKGHFQSAVNVPHETIANHIKMIEPNKNAPIHLYCRSGRRAEVARKTLLDMGYTNVINHGGYQALYDKGYR